MYLPYRPAEVDNVFNTSLRAFRDVSKVRLDHEDAHTASWQYSALTGIPP